MSARTTKKTTKPVSTAAAEKTEIVHTIATLYTNGVERLAQVHKKSIDLALKQNADSIDAWKKIAQAVPGAPGLLLFDLAANAFDRLADKQKGAVDLFTEQSHALTSLVKERAASATEAFDGALAVVKQTVDQSVAAQKRL